MGGGSAYPCAEESQNLELPITCIQPACFEDLIPSFQTKSIVYPGFGLLPMAASDVHPLCPCQYKIKCKEPNELVSIFSEACPNLRLALGKDDVTDAVLVERNPKDDSQLWRKIEVGKDNGWFFDRAGQPGFILVNEHLHVALKHGYQSNKLVVLDEKSYQDNTREGTIIWSQGKSDLGQGYRAVRPVTDISLNLDIVGVDKKNRVVKDGTSVFLNTWDKKKPSMRWILQLEPEPEHEHIS